MPRHRKKTRADFEVDWYGLPVKVIWADVLYMEEATESEIRKQPDVEFRSYGEVVGKTSRNLTLCCSIGNEKRDKTLREVIRIPLSLIRSITLLNEGEEVQL